MNLEDPASGRACRRVALVGCSKRKAKTAAGQKLPARELYAPSHLFRLQLGDAHAIADHVFILSAQHGLVGLDDPLATYDRHMGQLSPDKRTELGRQVIQGLVDRFGLFGAQPLELHVFAGAPYVDVLRAALPEGWRIVNPLAGQTLFERRTTLRAALPEGWRIVNPLAGQTLFERRTTLRAAAAGRAQPVKRSELRLPALRIQQSEAGRQAYSFAVDGKLVPTFATISRQDIERLARLLTLVYRERSKDKRPKRDRAHM